MSIRWCPTCCRHAAAPNAPECEECVRRRRYGAIVEALFIPWPRSVVPAVPQLLDALDAIAELWIDRHRALRRHRREMFEEQREAQRGAREAYAQGCYEGAGGERGDW